MLCMIVQSREFLEMTGLQASSRQGLSDDVQVSRFGCTRPRVGPVATWQLTMVSNDWTARAGRMGNG
jgi:hypothetical protein